MSNLPLSPPPPPPPPPIPALYTVPLTDKMSPEYARMLEDLVRMLVIQLTLQFLLYLTDPSQFSLFSTDFIVLLIYIGIAVVLYWLLFKKLVQFT
jgi:hypothetical protein